MRGGAHLRGAHGHDVCACKDGLDGRTARHRVGGAASRLDPCTLGELWACNYGRSETGASRSWILGSCGYFRTLARSVPGLASAKARFVALPAAPPWLTA